MPPKRPPQQPQQRPQQQTPRRPNKKEMDIASQQRQREQQEVEQAFRKGIADLHDFIAPSSMQFDAGYFRLGTYYVRSYYVYGYPRQIYTGWVSGLINIDEELDISMHIYPVESRVVLNNLRKKVSQLEADIQISQEKGRVRDPATEAAIIDAEALRDRLQIGEEKFFRLGLYFTSYARTLDELDFIQNKLETILGQQLVYSKPATVQMEQGFNSTLPQASDQLEVHRNMNTDGLSSSFPFTSADLTDERGILYGINLHNNGLVIFDRFSLENANSVIFAKSGAGKSFTVKLEALRSLMVGTEIIIVDPEDEYRRLCDAVGGSYVKISLNSDTRINPFDLPKVVDREEADSELRSNLIVLHGLLRLMMGGSLTPAQESDLDQALIDTYNQVGITNDPLTHQTPPPTISDLYDILLHMQGDGPALAQAIRKYTKGTFAGIFSQQSNININNKMVVFNIRDLEEELRPIAMYIILNHIWNKTKSDKRKRILIIDEAWQLMKYEDSASFLFSVAKRARKYYLGLTTISQDVEDFMSDKLGRAIVSNSSLQFLMKQSTSSADVLANVFKLTSEEKKRLMQLPVGQGIFFAGANHVHMQVTPSPTEYTLMTTSPQQLEQMAKEASLLDQATKEE